jgi:hypothetical protein
LTMPHRPHHIVCSQNGTGMKHDTYACAAKAVRGVLTALRKAPHLDACGPGALRLRRGFREHLNYSFILTDPLQRVAERLPLYAATARIVWMMSANNRLPDIAFHVPAVASFTDDELTVPGSSYRMRLRQPQPGLDQVLGAIDRLKKQPDGRQAAVTIFHPMDAVRPSADIPCAFGMLFHNRGGSLLTTVIMRSNNALKLLHFNLFEFSLLAEVVAVEAGLTLGPITYFAGSMHLYDDDAHQAGQFLGTQVSVPPTLVPMPTDVSPLRELITLAKFEAALRHGSAALNSHSVKGWLDRAAEQLHPYWAQFAFVLVAGVAANVNRRTLDLASNRVRPDLRPFLPALTREAEIAEPVGSADLFGQGASTPVLVPFYSTPVMEKFAVLAKAHEKETGALLGAATLLGAQQIVSERLAARGEANALTQEVFLQALQAAG